MWQGFDAMPDGQSPSDSWSNASAQGPAVPTTLNVEDWCAFFLGIVSTKLIIYLGFNFLALTAILVE